MKHHDGRSTLNRPGRLFALVCLAGLGLTGTAHAVLSEREALSGWSPKAGGGFARNVANPNYPGTSRVLANVGTSVVATTTATIGGPAGALIVSTAATLSRANIGAAVGRCLLMANPLCIAAAAGTALWAESLRIKSEGGGIVQDPGQSKQTVAAWLATVTNPTNSQLLTATSDTQLGAASAVIPGLNKVTGSNTACLTHYDYRAGAVLSATQVRYQQRLSYTQNPTGNYGTCGPAGNVGAWTDSGIVTTSQTSVQQCPSYIDFQYGLQPPGSTPGADGKCKTGVYSGEITPIQVGEKFTQFPPSDQAAVVQNVLQGGQEIEPESAATSGPTQQTGTPTSSTTVGPLGTSTQTSTPTYHYEYGGDSDFINYTTTTTVEMCTGAESCTTTTTTEAPPVENDPKDPCTTNPDRLGCTKLGTAPTDQVAKVTRSIGFGAESVALPSGCPSDTVVQGKSFSYGPVCDAATAARPWVLVGAAFSALMLCLAAIRSI